MNITVDLNEELVQQAQLLSNASSTQVLLESSLLALIKHINEQNHSSINVMQGIGKVSEKYGADAFEAPNTPSVYKGKPLSLNEINWNC